MANGLDDDCDGEVDEGTDDQDGDGWPASGGDCNDDSAWVNPEQDEMCDGMDNDCDESIDEGCEAVAVTAPAVGGCGCDSGANAAGFFASFGALLAARTRRRR